MELIVNKKLQIRRPRTGFTLVEILIVVLIMGVLMNIALPAFIHTRDTSQSKSCSANLQTIMVAKEEYAMDNNASNSYTPVWNDIQQYVKSSGTPLCPSTGAPYILGSINVQPICSYGGPVGIPHLAP